MEFAILFLINKPINLQNKAQFTYFAPFLIILIVITKARGIRPIESLATLYSKEGATFYHAMREQITREFLSLSITFLFFLNRIFRHLNNSYSRFSLQSAEKTAGFPLQPGV